MAQLVLMSGLAMGTIILWFLFLRSWGIHLAYIWFAVFIVVMPFSSMTGDFTVDQLPLRGRMVAVGLMAVAAIVTCWRQMFTGVTAATLLLFMYVWFASFYSEYPFVSMKLKLIGLASLVAGVGLARPLMISKACFLRNLRLLLLPMAIPMVFFLLDVLQPGGKGRLGSLGLNPNSIGVICAGSLIVSLYIAAWDRAGIFRIIAMILSAGYAICVVATGSRASFGAAAICALLILAPLLVKPGRILLVCLAIGISAWIMIAGVTVHAASRVTDFELDSGRFAIWSYLIQNSQGSFLLGEGTLFATGARWGGIGWRNALSIYVQVWCETGLIGLLLLLFVMAYQIRSIWQVLWGQKSSEKWLVFALCSLPFIIGFAESMPLQGNTIVTLLWGMGVGLLDGLRRPGYLELQVEPALSAGTVLHYA